MKKIVLIIVVLLLSATMINGQTLASLTYSPSFVNITNDDSSNYEYYGHGVDALIFFGTGIGLFIDIQGVLPADYVVPGFPAYSNNIGALPSKFILDFSFGLGLGTDLGPISIFLGGGAFLHTAMFVAEDDMVFHDFFILLGLSGKADIYFNITSNLGIGGGVSVGASLIPMLRVRVDDEAAPGVLYGVHFAPNFGLRFSF